MSSARGEPRGGGRAPARPPLGLRARLTLWTTAVLAASLGAGFAWVHHNLRAVLAARDDAFLVSKAEELASVVRDDGRGAAGGEGRAALEAEIRREVAAYDREGLGVVVRRPGAAAAFPPTR